jgi:hypothetical protein
VLDRSAIAIAPELGLLRAEHFQVAYATGDIDQALALFATRYGVTQWARLEGALATGGHIRVELAWMGTVMIELLSAHGEGAGIYMDRLAGQALRLHHLGYLIDDDAQWDALMRCHGDRLAHVSHNTGFMKSCFVDAPELGHYLEYICPEPAGRAFFQSVPRH